MIWNGMDKVESLYINNSDVKNLADKLLNDLDKSSLEALDIFIFDNIKPDNSPSIILKILQDGSPSMLKAAKSSTPFEKASNFLVSTLSGLGLSVLLTKGFFNEINPEKNPHLFPRITDERILVSSIVTLGLVLVSYIIYYRAISMDLRGKLDELEKKITEVSESGKVKKWSPKSITQLPKNIKK